MQTGANYQKDTISAQRNQPTSVTIIVTHSADSAHLALTRVYRIQNQKAEKSANFPESVKGFFNRMQISGGQHRHQLRQFDYRYSVENHFHTYKCYFSS